MLTPQQVKDFKSSDLWSAIVAEINTRIDIRHIEMEDPDGLLSVEDLYRAQGGIKAYKEVKDNILETILGILEEGKDLNV